MLSNAKKPVKNGSSCSENEFYLNYEFVSYFPCILCLLKMELIEKLTFYLHRLQIPYLSFLICTLLTLIPFLIFIFNGKDMTALPQLILKTSTVPKLTKYLRKRIKRKGVKSAKLA